MVFSVIFSSKPKNDTRQMAIDIANQCDTQIIDGYYHVHFNEINQNFKTLLGLSQRWSTSKFIVGNSEEDPRKVLEILLCFSYDRCDGFCFQLQLIRWLDLVELSSKLRRYNSGQWRGDFNSLGLSPLLFEYGLFLKSDDGEKISINKEKIREFINRIMSLQLKYCDKFDREKIFSKVNMLPDEINTINPESNKCIPEISRNVVDQNLKSGVFLSLLE